MMVRIIARLDVKSANLIKGIHLEGLRVIGPANEYGRRYYTQGIDELIYMDAVASLYGRNHLAELVRDVACDVFVPMTVGGGIRSVEDVTALLRVGADKVAINTAVVRRPELISEISYRFGSQCMVLSIEAKRVATGWEVYTNCGREPSGNDVVEWARRGVELGAGEILLTSIDREGTRTGYDLELIQTVSQAVSVPVIASGGMGVVKHAVDAVCIGRANAIAMADALHYGRFTVRDIRSGLKNAGIDVRSVN